MSSQHEAVKHLLSRVPSHAAISASATPARSESPDEPNYWEVCARWCPTDELPDAYSVKISKQREGSFQCEANIHGIFCRVTAGDWRRAYDQCVDGVHDAAHEAHDAVATLQGEL